MSDTVEREDLFVPRDTDGDLLPQEMDTQVGTIEAYPVTYGDANEYLGDGGISALEPETIAELFREKIIDPDLSDIDADDVEHMRPLVPATFLNTLLSESGVEAEVDVDEDGQATVTVAAGN